jgi:uncharacterized RDD family membrane protein YckC
LSAGIQPVADEKRKPLQIRNNLERGQEILSTASNQAVAIPSWKEEVNRRLAEHKSRKESPVPEQTAATPRHMASNSRAAQAAARVAARYANAPSFNEAYAEEARAKLRTAEAAARVALEANVAAQAALEQLHPSVEEEEAPARLSVVEAAPAIGEYRMEAASAPVTESRWNWEEMGAPVESEGAEVVEPAQPIPANLLQFPRELVAARKMRPSVGTAVADAPGQLSIFEVAPETVSTEPEAMSAGYAFTEAQEWTAPEWSSMEFDEHSEFEDYPIAHNLPMAQTIDLAPFSARLMSALVDFSLVTAAVAGFVFLVARYLHPAFSIKTAEIAGVALLAAVAVAYEWFFLTKFGTTPGMRYAGLDLCTFDDRRPSREQIIARFRSMLFSLLPLGLGLAWALFDEDNLSWHDRRSRTYLRRN